MIICVTGKMAAGKNYISSLLEEFGFSCIDADVLVHKAIEIYSEEIFSTFKDEAEKMRIILKNPDGSINRRALGSLVFSDKELLKKQEVLVYPKVVDLTKDFVNANSGKNIAINATVLFKTPEILSLCSKILFVEAPFFTRIKRAKKRDGLSLSKIFQRLNAQKNLRSEYKKTGISIVSIRNTGPSKKIKRRLKKILAL